LALYTNLDRVILYMTKRDIITGIDIG